MHQKTIQLGLGQGIGPLVLDGVLGGHDQEGLGQRVGAGAHGDLVLAHGLQQGRLDLGRGPVDLVGQDQIVEQGAGLELEAAGLRAVDVGPGQVTGEQVRGELDALKVALDAPGQLLDRGGLGQPGCALDQQVAVRQQGDEQALDELALADDASIELVAQAHEGGAGDARGRMVGLGDGGTGGHGASPRAKDALNSRFWA